MALSRHGAPGQRTHPQRHAGAPQKSRYRGKGGDKVTNRSIFDFKARFWADPSPRSD